MLKVFFKKKKDKNTNNKMAINTYLSIIESKKENKWANRTETDSDKENILTVARWEGVGGMDEKGEGIKKFKFVVTE